MKVHKIHNIHLLLVIWEWTQTFNIQISFNYTVLANIVCVSCVCRVCEHDVNMETDIRSIIIIIKLCALQFGMFNYYTNVMKCK